MQDAPRCACCTFNRFEFFILERLFFLRLLWMSALGTPELTAAPVLLSTVTLSVCEPVASKNDRAMLSASTAAMSSQVSDVMRCRIFRMYTKLVSCQLVRLRMLPRAQATKTGGACGRKTIAVRHMHNGNVVLTLALGKVSGSEMEASLLHLPKAFSPTAVNRGESVRDLRLLQRSNALSPRLVSESGSDREARWPQSLNAWSSMLVIWTGNRREVRCPQ